MVVVEARDEARAVLVLLVLRAGIPPVEMAVHDEVLVTCGAAIHETPLSPWSGGRPSCRCARTGHRMTGGFSAIRRTGPFRAADVCSRPASRTGSCGGARDRGRQGRHARRRIEGGGDRRRAGPARPPHHRRARPRRARDHGRLPRAGPREGGRPAARDQPRHELPGAAHPRARGVRGPPRPWLLRLQRQGHVALAPLPGQPRRGAEPPPRPQAAAPRRRRRTPTSRCSAVARSPSPR